MLKRFQLLALLLLLAPNVKAQTKWVDGYYAGWQTSGYPEARIDYTAITHLMLAYWASTATGGVSDNQSWNENCGPVVTAAHAAGVKVIMMLGGAGDSNFASAASPTYQSAFISSIASTISNCNLDGVDLDWEQNVNQTNFISLAQNLHSAYPSFIITVPIDPTVQPSSLPEGLYPYVNQVNMMTYGWGAYNSESWYFAALDGYNSNHLFGIKTFVANWEAAGVPASKIGFGIGFYAVGYTSVYGPNQSLTGATNPFGELPYGWSLSEGGGVLSCYYNTAMTYSFDPSPAENSTPSNPPEEPALSDQSGFTASTCSSTPINWVTYEDEASIAAKGNYLNSAGLGGVIIWTLGEGAVDPNTGRSPQLDAVKRYVNNSGPAPMPKIGDTGAVSVAGATTLGPITGLSTSLGMVNVKWWNYTSGVAWDDSSDTGYATYGQPSAYTIQASTNGSSWTTLSTISSEHYTGRQFAYDFTGTGYTQIRMVVSSIVGAAGYDDFAIYGQASTRDDNDTWLFFGDSITANCLAAATGNGGTGPVEQLGSQINAQQPIRYPAVTVGGQSGWLSSTALSTTTYSIANIKQFMNDMPAVKFVTINLGTNDANEGVSASTYCANMQSIVQYIIDAGKTPVIPTIVASPSSAIQANAPAMNSCLATLEQNYPSIVKGPDLWNTFAPYTSNSSYWLDSIHPSLGVGCTLWQSAWVSTMLSAIYPSSGSGTPPNPPTNLTVTVN